MDSRQPSEHPAAGETITPPIHCRNCGKEIQHAFCGHCGQHRADHNQGLGHFLKEFWGEFVQVDSKFIRTIVPLCLKPGYLTQQWVAGKRVRYITPLKLYLTISALCFLIVSYQYSQNADFKSQDLSKKGSSATSIKINGTDVMNFDEGDGSSEKLTKKQKEKLSAVDAFFEELFSGIGKPGPEGDAKRKDFSDKFVGRLSTANFLLLPVFALLFKVLYIRRSRFYVEHLVFALHYYAFFFLGLGICMLAKTPYVVVPITIWMTVYLPIAMYQHYRQGVIKTFFKCTIFGFSYLIAVSIALVGLVIITAIDTEHLNAAKIASAAKKLDAAQKLKTPKADTKPAAPFVSPSSAPLSPSSAAHP